MAPRRTAGICRGLQLHRLPPQRSYLGLWARGTGHIALTAPGDGLVRYVQGDWLQEVLSCRACGNTVGWRSLQTGADGQRRMAVNLRLAEPATVVAIPLKRFDGLER